MRLLLLSDIHTEFQADRGKSFFEAYKNVDYDVAVIPGDLTDYNGLNDSLKFASDNLKEVIYCKGNHEAYNSSIEKTDNTIRSICEKLPNIHFLERDTVTVSGQRFVGCTLWFSDDPMNAMYEHQLNDFRKIKSFKSEVYKINTISKKWLMDTVESTDIVLTHYLPSERCVHKIYKNDPINRFFVCNIENVIVEKQPKLIAIGHTHTSFDFHINSTRLVCNPFGYLNYELNPDFIQNLIIDV